MHTQDRTQDVVINQYHQRPYVPEYKVFGVTLKLKPTITAGAPQCCKLIRYLAARYINDVPLEIHSPQYSMYVYTYVCMDACMYVRAYMYTYVRTYVCMYVCMYTCMYVCILSTYLLMMPQLPSQENEISQPVQADIQNKVNALEKWRRENKTTPSINNSNVMLNKAEST